MPQSGADDKYLNKETDNSEQKWPIVARFGVDVELEEEWWIFNNH